MGIFSRKEHSEPTMYINVIAQIDAKPDYAAEVRKMLEALVYPSRSEKGYKGYHLLEDAKQPGSFRTYETWASEEHLQRHLNSEGTKQVLAKAKPMLAGEMQLNVYRHLH